MRDSGYYFVRYMSKDEWNIGYWNGDYWEIASSRWTYKDSDFEEIDENKIERKALHI